MRDAAMAQLLLAESGPQNAHSTEEST
jgi:hypothetical protein